MLKDYLNHNRHWESIESFKTQDPHLRGLFQCQYIAEYVVLAELPLDTPGIYTLSGGRQLGKSTCLKQWMIRALTKTPPQNIFYLACDTILDRTHLYQILKIFLDAPTAPSTPGLKYLFIDEITFIKGWDLTIKALADEGLLECVVCCLTGSDKIFLEEAITRLPGRRGPADQIDFELKPLLFKEVIELYRHQDPTVNIQDAFSQYLQTGGYITAINDLAQTSSIQPATCRTYQQWMIGDFMRLNLSKKNLLQTLYALVHCYGSQVSFHSLSQHTEDLSKDTINKYCAVLERLGVIAIQPAFDQNTLRAAPKKHKKIHFLDPFITHAVVQLINSDYQKIGSIEESLLVESICYNHYQRQYPTYYIKADGEVDIVYVDGKTFFPVEIKWRNQIRPKDIKQIKKYPNALILSREQACKKIHDVRAVNLVHHLAGI